MLQKMFSIYDSKGEMYNPPFFQPTHGEAERNFTTLVNDPKSVIHTYTEDFDLYFVGEYDPSKGQFHPEFPPKHLLKASQLKKNLT